MATRKKARAGGTATPQFAVRWPRFLKRGGIKDDGLLYCYSYGLNCASWELPFQVFSAPDRRSKHHDPELTARAEQLNALFAGLAKSKGRSKRMLRVVLLDDQLCLTASDVRPDTATEGDMKKLVRQGTDLDLLSPEEIYKVLDVPVR